MTQGEIFVLRQTLDAKRQDSFARDLTDLVAAVAALPASHPYDLTFAVRCGLAQQYAGYGQGAHGWHASIAARKLYRFASMGDLLRSGITWHRRTNDADAFSDFHSRYLGLKRDWLPLSMFAKGRSSNYRGFSWWTSYDLLARRPSDAWRHVGLLDDWMMRDTVLVRCTVGTDCPPPTVPSAVDGFDGPVFETQPMASVVGRTIDLSAPEPCSGAIEVVLSQIPVELLEIRPLIIDEAMKREGTPAPKDDSTWRRLASYYSRLIAQ